MFSLVICDFNISICGFNTIVTCNSYKNERLYLLQKWRLSVSPKNSYNKYIFIYINYKAKL